MLFLDFFFFFVRKVQLDCCSYFLVLLVMVVDDSINNMAFLMPRVVTPAEVTQDANLHVSVQELPKKKKTQSSLSKQA